MNLLGTLDTKLSPSWLKADSRILSVHLSYARNLTNIPFPHKNCPHTQLSQATKQIYKSLDPDLLARSLDLNELSTNEQNLLKERFIMGPPQNKSTSVSFNEDESQVLTINHKDHLRIRFSCCFKEIDTQHQKLQNFDREIRQCLPIAKDRRLGYLSPYNQRLGSGLKISMLLALSSLTLTEQLPQIQRSAQALGFTLKNFTSSDKPLLWILENTHSLGRTEDDILISIKNLSFQILEAEKQAHQELLNKESPKPSNLYSRAWWSLLASTSISSSEAQVFAETLICARLDQFTEQYTAQQALNALILTQDAHLKHKAPSLSTEQLEKVRYKSFCDLIQAPN